MALQLQYVYAFNRQSMYHTPNLANYKLSVVFSINNLQNIIIHNYSGNTSKSFVFELAIIKWLDVVMHIQYGMI